MAQLTREDILKLAQLSRIGLTEAEVDEFAKELNEILKYVEQLSTVDTANLGPTSQVTGLTNVTRPDTIKEYGYQAHDLLKNVPHTEGDLIKVKRMIG